MVEIPVRWSLTDEQVALRRIHTLARLENEVLAYYLARANAYVRDPLSRVLRAERREAILDGRLPASPKIKKTKKKQETHVPESVTPRRIVFQEKQDRYDAWRALQERHGLFGDAPLRSLTPAGREQYEQKKAVVKTLTARQKDCGNIGLDSATINVMFNKQRDRVLAWLGIKRTKSVDGGTVRIGKPRFNSARHRRTSVLFASGTNANRSGLVVDITAGTTTWKAAKGEHAIVARLRWPKRDPYIRKAASAKIAQVKILYREVNGVRRWFVQMTMVGVPPLRPTLRNAVVQRPHGVVGIDIGSRHVAVVGPEAALLADFAPTMLAREIARDANIVDKRDGDRVKKDRWMRRLQRRGSRQRERNPLNVNKRKTIQKTLVKTRDGNAVGKTVEIEGGFKKGARIVTSNRLRRLNARLATTESADAAARKNDHGRLVNIIATYGDTVILEHLAYRAWQRSFGRSVRRYAPGKFEEHARERASLLGMEIQSVETSARMSQLCHACGTFTKEPIRGPIAKRMKRSCSCGREAVHRDLYSAFLARFAGEDSSVDLQAAKVAWSGAFGLLRGAQQVYDRAHAAGLPAAGGASGVIPRASTLDVPLSPATFASGARQAEILERSTPTSVRDAGVRDGGGDGLFERVNGSEAPQTRSNAVVWAPLPPSEAQKRRRRARAEPPLET